MKMAVEKTLSIIKPDAVKRNLIGEIYRRFESNGLKIAAARMLRLAKEDAERFYEVHRGKPFFLELVNYMSSGRIMVQVLEGENAVLKNREIMGATDPAKALPGSIRKDLGLSMSENSVHGSDALETAAVEIAFFFPAREIFLEKY
jgi:nucleoside-diphosphate kinase